jgi:hypothetical protein
LAKAARRVFLTSVVQELRRRVLVALDLLTWIDQQRLALNQLRQDDLDRWLDRETTQNNMPAEGTDFAVYQCALPLSKQTITVVTEALRTHLKTIGSWWRKLPAGKIAVIVLAVLRHDQRLADLAGGNDVSPSTVRRWVWEVIGLLAARAPRLQRALNKISVCGGDVVLMDGTLVRTRRRGGKPQPAQLLRQAQGPRVVVPRPHDERGNLLWISAARPGRSAEITTARHNHITTRLREAGLGALADLGFVGLDDQPDDTPVIITGRTATRTRKLTTAEKHANALLGSHRAPVEHGFADLKNWRILTKLRLDPGHATQLLRALLVLTNLEITR